MGGGRQTDTDRKRNWVKEMIYAMSEIQREVVVVGWVLNVPATCECISGTDLLRQYCVLPN